MHWMVNNYIALTVSFQLQVLKPNTLKFEKINECSHQAAPLWVSFMPDFKISRALVYKMPEQLQCSSETTL